MCFDKTQYTIEFKIPSHERSMYVTVYILLCRIIDSKTLVRPLIQLVQITKSDAIKLFSEFLRIINPFSAGIVFRRQNLTSLTSKEDPRIEKIITFIMSVDL